MGEMNEDDFVSSDLALAEGGSLRVLGERGDIPISLYAEMLSRPLPKNPEAEAEPCPGVNLWFYLHLDEARHLQEALGRAIAFAEGGKE
jgi:hypothetical protein